MQLNDLNPTGESSLDILVELAKSREIDPWDVDLEVVTEKYLSALNSNPSDNLREAGKAIFFASVLLRMKSDVLAAKSDEALMYGIENDLDEAMLIEQELAEDNKKTITYKDLEKAITRRSINKAKRFRNITLVDLIDALQAARDEEEKRAFRVSQRNLFDDVQLDDYDIAVPEVAEDIMELTHAENLEEAIERLRPFLKEHLIDGNKLNFSEVVSFAQSWSNAFLAVCFLAHEKEVELEQKPEDFYGDLFLYEFSND